MIDREKVIKGFTCCEIDASCANCPYSDSNICIADLRKDVFELLKEQPLQRHGHWVRLPKFLVESQCSVCGETYVGDCRTFNFCPTCGAEMDGEVEVKQDG